LTQPATTAVTQTKRWHNVSKHTQGVGRFLLWLYKTSCPAFSAYRLPFQTYHYCFHYQKRL